MNTYGDGEALIWYFLAEDFKFICVLEDDFV